MTRKEFLRTGLLGGTGLIAMALLSSKAEKTAIVTKYPCGCTMNEMPHVQDKNGQWWSDYDVSYCKQHKGRK